MGDGENSIIFYVEKIMSFFSTIQALELAKPPEKYATADTMVAMTLKIFKSMLKNWHGFYRF